MTDNTNPRPHRRRADQTMDVLAANIPLLLLADLAGDGTQPVTEDAANDEEQQVADANPAAEHPDADFGFDVGSIGF